jgi:hypothetical protein
MQKDLTAIYILIDGSGSMAHIKKGVISGFNEFIESQKTLPGETIFSLTQFSSSDYPLWVNNSRSGSLALADNSLSFRPIYHLANLKTVDNLTESSYSPYGTTPLLQAMTKAIEDFGEDLKALPEKNRPSKVVFVTITDGLENSSNVQFTKEKLSTVVKHQENKYAWQFIYLGANQDSFSEGMSIGIHNYNSANYVASEAGIRHAIRTASAWIGSYRSGLTSNVNLSTAQVQDQDLVQTIKAESQK